MSIHIAQTELQVLQASLPLSFRSNYATENLVRELSSLDKRLVCGNRAIQVSLEHVEPANYLCGCVV